MIHWARFLPFPSFARSRHREVMARDPAAWGAASVHLERLARLYVLKIAFAVFVMIPFALIALLGIGFGFIAERCEQLMDWVAAPVYRINSRCVESIRAYNRICDPIVPRPGQVRSIPSK